MPDIAPLLVAILSALAIPLVAIGLLGKGDASKPRCRRCGADAPAFSWYAPSLCACGAVLTRPGALRIPGRRRWRVLVVGVALAAMATALGCEAARVYADGLGWRNAMPTWLFVRTHDRDYDSFVSPQRDELRLNSHLSRAEAQRWLATLLDEEPPAAAEPFGRSHVICALAHLAPPEGEVGRRFVERVLQSSVLLARRGTLGTEVRLEGGPAMVLPPLFVRVDSATVDGEEHAVRLVSRDEPIERRWFNVAFPPRMVIDGTDGERATIVVRGAAAYCGPVEGCVNNDPLITAIDDPAQWKLPVAMASFEMTATSSRTAAISSFVFPSTWAPPSRYAAFFAPYQNPQPLTVAASNLIGSACAGSLAGLAFAVGLLVTRVSLRRRRALVAPSCGACGATVRGTGASMPERCSECGRSLETPSAIVKTAATHRILRAGLVSWVVALGAFAVAAWYAPRVASNVSARWEIRSLTGATYGAWMADRFLMDGSMPLDDQIARGIVTRLPNGDAAREIALRRIAERWREPEPALKRAHPLDSQRTLANWAGAIVSVISEFGADEYQRALDDVVAECGGPCLSMPRCVRVGESIRVVRAQSDLPAEVRVRIPSSDATEASWRTLERFALPAASEPGEIDCEVEWLLAWKAPQNSAPDVADRVTRLAKSGVLRQRVLVLPRDATSTADGRANPFAPPSRIVMGIEEIGERDWIWINVLPENGGAMPHGRFDFDFGAVASSKTSMFGMSALVARPSPLPDEITLTFVPTRRSAGASAVPPILWNEKETMRLRRTGYSPLHRAEIYERK